MINPTITLKSNDKEIFKLDLWWLALIYAPKNLSVGDMKLYLNDEEVVREVPTNPIRRRKVEK